MNRITRLALVLGVVLLLGACGDEARKEIRLLSGESRQELASSHMAAAVLEQAGFEVGISQANLGLRWQQDDLEWVLAEWEASGDLRQAVENWLARKVGTE